MCLFSMLLLIAGHLLVARLGFSCPVQMKRPQEFSAGSFFPIQEVTWANLS